MLGVCRTDVRGGRAGKIAKDMALATSAVRLVAENLTSIAKTQPDLFTITSSSSSSFFSSTMAKPDTGRSLYHHLVVVIVVVVLLLLLLLLHRG